MNLNKPTLIEFESERLKNNFIPPDQSNSFYTIGEGSINLFCKRAIKENCRFDLFTKSGTTHIGEGNFLITGDIIDSTKPYNSFTVINGTHVIIDEKLSINKGRMDIHGKLEMVRGSSLIVSNGAEVILYPDSTFIVDEECRIIVEPGASISIYGDINVKLSVVYSILENKDIYIDSAAHVNVENLGLGERPYSFTDYEKDLREIIINPHTQGEYNSSIGRIGYRWTSGDTKKKSQRIRLSLLWGEWVLGDFKLSVLGRQSRDIPDLQVVEEFHVDKNTTLYILDSYKDKMYIRPELYLGIVISNSRKPGSCVINGTVIVDGINSSITVDRGAKLTIKENGFIYLRNGAKIKSTHNKNESVFYINGTLVIDRIDQINSFNKENIKFGDKGKIVILNPDDGTRRVLFSTPNGIHNTDLYRLFYGRLNHIQYHIPKNNGIRIDQYYEFYPRDMVKWYSDIRIEKAIYDKLIVMEDGAFIELDKEIIPWVNKNCSLLHAARVFKSYGSTDEEKLQEVVERLRYAGAGNIVFRFVDGTEFTDITMILDGINMKSIVNKPLTGVYTLTTDNTGDLYFKNQVSNTTPREIINDTAKHVRIVSDKTDFELK